MDNSTKRPIRVWIMAILLMLATAAGSVVVISEFVKYWEYDIIHPVTSILWPIVKISIVLLTAIGLLRRWRWSRWAVVAMIIGWLYFYTSHEIAGLSGTPNNTPFANSMDVPADNPAYLRGRFFGLIIINLIILTFTATFAFGKSVREYFSPPPAS